jgi:hypothetical protein
MWHQFAREVEEMWMLMLRPSIQPSNRRRAFPLEQPGDDGDRD